MQHGKYAVESVVSAPFDQVAYVVWEPGRDLALVVDPGFDTDSIAALLRRHGLTPAAILNTHGHADHIAGNAAMKDVWPDAPLVIGRGDAHLLRDAQANLSAPFGMPMTSPPADRLVGEGETLAIETGGFALRILEIPGHSPGSVVYLLEQEGEPPLALAGDVLFAGSIGRSDLPGGDHRTLVEGIRGKLFTLPAATVVLPGHGPPTTVAAERRRNPFVGDDVVWAG